MEASAIRDLIVDLIPILVTLIAGGIAYWRYIYERGHRELTLMNSLFGELGSVLEHYAYSVYEIDEHTGADAPIRLAWSKYGHLHFTRDVTKYGFLNASEIQLLLQLGLRIRNSDHLFEVYRQRLSETGGLPSLRDVEGLKERMEYIMQTTSHLLNALVQKNPKLKAALESVTQDLPAPDFE